MRSGSQLRRGNGTSGRDRDRVRFFRRHSGSKASKALVHRVSSSTSFFSIRKRLMSERARVSRSSIRVFMRPPSLRMVWKKPACSCGEAVTQHSVVARITDKGVRSS